MNTFLNDAYQTGSPLCLLLDIVVSWGVVLGVRIRGGGGEKGDIEEFENISFSRLLFFPNLKHPNPVVSGPLWTIGPPAEHVPPRMFPDIVSDFQVSKPEHLLIIVMMILRSFSGMPWAGWEEARGV